MAVRYIILALLSSVVSTVSNNEYNLDRKAVSIISLTWIARGDSRGPARGHVSRRVCA